MSEERHETVADNVSVNHQVREVAKMIPHEEVDVSKMETTTPTREKSSAVGNAAAMHKALEKFNAVDLSGLEFPLDGDSSTIYNSNKKEITIPYCKVAEFLNGVKEAQDMAKAALSAPPRNFDRFDNIKGAMIRYCAEVEYVPIWDGFYSQRLIKWLFAQKKEEK